MYYELGTMVRIRKDALPFVNHEKGIGYPRLDVIGEIVTIHPEILSYTVRLSRKYTLTFSDDDIYGLPGWMSSRHDMFHKMISTDKVNQPFYYSKELELFIDDKMRLSDRQLIDPDIKKYCEHDCRTTYETFNNVYPEHFPGYHYRPVESSLKALEEFNKREAERIAASPIRIDIDDEIKAHYSKEEIKKMINNAFGAPVISLPLTYKKIIFSGPCTIILWKDGTKTIAKTSDGETFDPEKGVSICFMKKMLGHTETNKILRKASKDFYDEISRIANKQFDEELKKATFPLPKGVTFRSFNFDVPMDNNAVVNIDQSTIEEVKKVEEDQDD